MILVQEAVKLEDCKTWHMITNEIIEKLRRLQPQVKNWQGNVLLDPEKVDKRWVS